MIVSPPTRPRRRKRGLSITGSLVFLALFSVSVALVTEVVSEMIHTLSVQSEARSLSRLADAARSHAARNPTQLMQSIRTNPDGHVLFGAADLESTGWLAPGEELRTSRRRQIRLAALAASASPTEERIIVLAWTQTGTGAGQLALPKAGPGITHVGRVGSANDGCGAGHVCGAGMRWDASAIFALLNPAPPVGAMAGLRLGHFTADRDPYLHRIDVGAPHVNRVDGSFDLNGFDLVGTGSNWEIREMETGGSLTAAGGVEFADVIVAQRSTVTADAMIDNMEAARVTVGGEAARAGLTAGGRAVIDRLEVSDRLGASTWTGAPASVFAAEGLAITGRLSLTGVLRIEDSWPTGSTAPSSAPRLAAGSVEIGNRLDVEDTGVWGTGEMSFEIADVNEETRMGNALVLESGGRGFIEFVETPSCTGC